MRFGGRQERWRHIERDDDDGNDDNGEKVDQKINKIVGPDKLLPHFQQVLDGFRKADPTTRRKLPVEADVPEFLVQLGLSPEACKLHHATGNLTMIAFYYLLRIGEYTTKGTRNNSRQTEEF